MSNTFRAGPYRPGGTTSLLRVRRGEAGWPPEDGSVGQSGWVVYHRAAVGSYGRTSTRPARSRKHRRR